MKSVCGIAIRALVLSFVLLPGASSAFGQAQPQSLQDLFKKNSPAVVVIEKFDASGNLMSLGSGFVVSPSGVIITNYHVVAAKPGARLVVKLANGDKYDDVWMVHDDQRRDFAVIAVRATGLPTAKLGDSEKVEVGEEVVAIGSPKGLELTFTAGVVSNVRLDPDGYRFIQHQTPISGGSSGSPLFNRKGEVIGINTFTVADAQNLNGAVPINYVKPYITDPPKMTYVAYAGVQPRQPVRPAPGAQPGQPAAPAPPPVNQEEEDAYKAFFDLKAAGDDQAMISSGEAFLKKFPESRYRESVYSRLAQAYLNGGQLDKMLIAGEKALELNPDDVDVLSLLSFGMLRRFNKDDLDAEQKLEKAERYAKHGIGVLGAMTKPEAITEEDFQRAKNEKLSMCNSGLGLSYLHRQRYVDSIAAFEQATTLSASPDPTDVYLLALLYEATRRYADAAATFTKCSEPQWAWQDRCKQGAEKNKKLAAIQGTPPKQ